MNELINMSSTVIGKQKKTLNVSSTQRTYIIGVEKI